MGSQAETLANGILRSSDEKDAEQQSRQLTSLLPTLTESESDNVIKTMNRCAKETPWKKRIAGSVIESYIIQKPSTENPLSIGIKYVFEQIGTLNFSGVDFIPSVIQLTVLIIVLILFGMLWLYGLTPVVAGALWKLILLSRARMMFKSRNVIEKMPYTMAIGIYFLVWLPFAVLCLPFVIVGWFGDVISSGNT